MAESTYWNRFWRRRISRRALLGAGAVTALGAASAAVLGCNGGGNGGGNGNGNGGNRTPAGKGTPVAGGNITTGRLIAALGIDPHIDLTGLDIDAMMYTYLYSWDRFTEEAVFNNLATGLEQPDDLTFIFTLRPDVMGWPKGPAAGEPLTSADCVASFKRRGTAITAPDKRFPQRIERYETPDSSTFKFVMSRRFVPAIREMANATWAIVPEKVLEKYKALGLGHVAFGNGPFMMKEFRGHERIVLERHPNYFLNPKPWLDTFSIIVITESSSLLAAFRSGQHDVNGAVLTKNTAQEFIDEPDKFSVSVSPSLFYPVLHLKMRGPWRDIRVREALNLAIKRPEIIETIQDGEGGYNGPIQWPQLKWALPQSELREFYRYDPERAKDLLKEAGFPEINVKVKYPEVPGAPIVADIAVLLKSQLAEVGINMELDAVELGAFIANTILPGNFDVAFFPNLPYDEPDRPLSFYHSKGVTGSGNWTNYTNPELDKLIDAQSEEFDEAKRQEIVYAAQRMILPEHGPQITMTGGMNYFAYWNHVNFGAQGATGFGGTNLGTPVPGEEYGPFGSEIWTEKA